MALEISKLVVDHNHALSLASSQLPPLGDQDVRIQVLFSGINRNDVLHLQGKLKKAHFGVEVIGKVIQVGSKVGSRKVGEIVGVYHHHCHKQHHTGFATHVQVSQHDAIFIPSTIAPEQAATLLGSGVIAFKTLEQVEKGSSVAVVGTGELAYVVTQYAKKVFGQSVTVFGYEGGEELLKSFGADSFVKLSLDSISKNNEKYQAVIVTDLVQPEEFKTLQNIAIRTGQIYLAIDMGYYPTIGCFDLVCGQREFTGVKKGSIGHYVRAFDAAAVHGVRSKVEVFEVKDYSKAFERAKLNSAVSVVLKY